MDWIGIVTAGVLFLAALGSVVAAIAAWRTIKETRKTAIAEVMGLITKNMGSFDDDIGKIRGALRKKLASGGVEELTETEKPDALKLSASFNRAATTIALTLDKDQIVPIIDLFGDVFLDFWVISFKSVLEKRDARGDHYTRMFFEYMAYVSYAVFERKNRRYLTRDIYMNGGGPVYKEEEVKTYMERRVKELDKSPSLRKLAKLRLKK